MSGNAERHDPGGAPSHHLPPDPAIELACLTAALVLLREEAAAGLIRRLRSAAEGGTAPGGAACLAGSSGAVALSREAVREAILQTYLFDGYPTALEGMALLAALWPGAPAPVERGESSDGPRWRTRGEDLYERIYGSVGPRLQERARELSPELAEWMVVEGYGKVLSRPGLDLDVRELAIIAVLTAKRRPRQLHSHLRGALRIGVPRARLERLLDALACELGAPGVEEARALLARLAG